MICILEKAEGAARKHFSISVQSQLPMQDHAATSTSQQFSAHIRLIMWLVGVVEPEVWEMVVAFPVTKDKTIVSWSNSDSAKQGRRTKV